MGDDLLGKWRDWYRPVLAILAAAQEPLTGDQLTHFTGLSEQDLHDIILDVQQFLDPGRFDHDFYQFYHQSLADFLKGKNRAGEFWIDLVSVHHQLAFFLGERPTRWEKNVDRNRGMRNNSILEEKMHHEDDR